MARILVMEDDPQVLSVVEEILSRAGHTVFRASNGVEGLRLFREHLPELVITDIFMPEKDGLEVIRELRRLVPTVRIIAASGGGSMGVNFLEVARILGSVHELPKPYDRKTLLAAVDKALTASPPAATA